MNIETFLNQQILNLNSREGESHHLIEWNKKSRRSTWDQKYYDSEYSSVFETQYSFEGETVFVLVGVNYDY